MTLIALDAMGGDHAPAEPVAGAVEAARAGVEVVLVGDEEAIKPQLEELGASLPIVHAPEVIGMHEDPARAIREKPNASVSVAAKLVKSGEAAGFLSAGSTGAAMAAGAIHIGRIPGVKRPSIASIWPTPPRPTVVLDSGANPDVKPIHLLQFALMGAVAAEVFLDMPDPRVGLLSIGEEEGKGRDLERATYRLLAESGLNFVGNVEGRDVGLDKADVIVTDGFTGNVFLKSVEGTARMVMMLAVEAISHLPAEDQAKMQPALTELRARLDPETYGGAHLLGVDGVVVIGHGSSTARSVANALKMASEGAQADLVGRLAQRISEA
ncbi:MAG: phosphate acyltransferase PlsX [Actinomycetes bacterium]|nr:phosphate acyltransferase PlsX [Acidimicrobiia bacterium]